MFLPKDIEQQMESPGGRRQSLSYASHHLNSWAQETGFERSSSVAIGVYIGERWTYVSAFQEGVISDVIKKMPSVITFAKENTFFGHDAFKHSFNNIENTIYGFFALLGKRCRLDRKYKGSEGMMKENIGIPIRQSEESVGKKGRGSNENKNSNQIIIYTPIQLVSMFLQHIVKESSQVLSSYNNVSEENDVLYALWICCTCISQALVHAAKLAKIENVRIPIVYCCWIKIATEEDMATQAEKDFQKKKFPGKTLIVDVSHMACSLAVVEAKTSRGGTEIVKVHSTAGSDLGGVGTILNDLSLHVVTRFVEQYQRHHEDNLHANDELSSYAKDNGLDTKHPLDDMNHLPTEHNAKQLKEIIKNNVIKADVESTNEITHRNNVDIGNERKRHNDEKKVVENGNIEKVSKHHKKLSMANRILAQYGSLTTLELSDDYIDKNASLSNGYNGTKEEKEEELITHWRRQSLLNGQKVCVSMTNSFYLFNTKKKQTLIQWNENDDDTGNDENQIKKAFENYEKSVEQKKQDEAMKCRFRARMICASVLEHLHDKYNKDISLHYDRFYGDYSLHLIMKLKTLEQLIIEPFVFEIRQQIDLLLQDTKETEIHDLNTCIVTGDGAAIPAVSDCIEEYFDVNDSLKNKPVVSRGCALVCAGDLGVILSWGRIMFVCFFPLVLLFDSSQFTRFIRI
ncbi:hypothetical protein RFI_19485 [Reticulomyxa filosa]|uniref:Uncharacterized protein n=1 Tax=Reticulomyxa filosa TaxID=46433 RepID=X6MXM5_RETFI|nr:hypothetical protein RFI_19485 [Reticulomyxa filosa]|eukprot:ETO17825.1 hypothetical protein RFI_19485 [Reticulomyxa filosa]